MIYSIVTVTLIEGIRNKAIYGITLIASLMMAFTVVLSGMIMRDVGKVATDMTLSTATFAMLLVVLFVGISILTKDIERKTIYVALSRSVPRYKYIIARFLGLVLLQTIILLLLLLTSLATLLLVKQIYGNFFGTVSLWLVVVAHFFVLYQMIIMTALSILFCLIASSPFVTFLLTTLTWIIGSCTQEVKHLVNSDSLLQIPPFTKTIVNIAYYLFPNLSLFDLKSAAAHGLNIDVNQLGLSLIYGTAYIIASLTLAIILFNRKELT